MIYTIENEYLQVRVSTYGAELQSIKSASGCEYLWQGDPQYWQEKAPVLFPVIARLQDKTLCVNGLAYPMEIHGFAKCSEFACAGHSTDSVTLRLVCENAPFICTLDITYRLDGNTLRIENKVLNNQNEPLHFALGGHPGFRVPLEDGEEFSDYYLEFSQKCTPELIGFTADSVLVSGQNRAYPLEDGRRIPLHHRLFDGDALIMQHAAREVSLKNRAGTHTVTVSYPDMPYIGFWHCVRADAPYVCIEPWSSLPGRAGVTEELSCRSDFVHLAPNKTWENIWTISIL